MNRFLDVVPLVLTPLTPIHIGCGEDFEPTNYVIDDGQLHHFEPARLSLTQSDRKLLMQTVNKRGDDAIRELQRFFHDRRSQCRLASRRAVPIARGVAERYAARVGQVAQRETGGRTVVNQLEIERTAHHLHTGVPYLPGSGLKGAIRTAWLNHLDKGPRLERDRTQKPSERSSDVEAALLGGTFDSDPFRLVDVGDASGAELQSRICFAVDRRKKPRQDRSGRPAPKDLSVCCEVIGGGQFRVLRGEIRFEHPLESAGSDPQRRIVDFTSLARSCNGFYLARLGIELETLEPLIARRWLDGFREMVDSIKPSLDEGRAMLLRVGRHSGAESVTLDRRRWIQIRGGRGQSHWARDATTIWLAAEREDSSSDIRPFGWLLIEPTDVSAPEALERWCNDEREQSNQRSGSDARTSRREAPAATGRAETSGQYLFHKGDRVTNGEEEATVVRDVRPPDARMEVEFEDGIEKVPVAGWRRV
jgi:CRISPR-associated protein Csm5